MEHLYAASTCQRGSEPTRLELRRMSFVMLHRSICNLADVRRMLQCFASSPSGSQVRGPPLSCSIGRCMPRLFRSLLFAARPALALVGADASSEAGDTESSSAECEWRNFMRGESTRCCRRVFSMEEKAWRLTCLTLHEVGRSVHVCI